MKLRLFLLGFIVLVVVIASGLYFFGNHMLRTGVSKAASKSVGREVIVQDMSLNLWRGNIGFNNITVENSEGYDFPFAMKIKQGFIDTNILSLLGQNVKVNSINISGVEIFIEQRSLNNNLRDLIADMPANEEMEEKTEEKGGKTVNVETTTVEDITVNIKIGKDGEEMHSLKLKIDPITIENLGTEKEIDTGVIAARVIMAILTGAIKQSTNNLPDGVVDQIKSIASDKLNLDNLDLGKGKKLLEENEERIIDGIRDIF